MVYCHFRKRSSVLFDMFFIDLGKGSDAMLIKSDTQLVGLKEILTLLSIWLNLIRWSIGVNVKTYYLGLKKSAL